MIALGLAFAFTSLVLASPVPEANPDPQLSFIPGILGDITGLLGFKPPPTSPAYQGSDIKPKKIGYFWTGSGDNEHADFLATYSLDDATFGQFIWSTDVPTGGNIPHHLSPSSDGKTLVGGGYLSCWKTQDSAYYFDVSNPYRPVFKKSNRALPYSITDEIRGKPDGGYFITYPGNDEGTSPGRLVETDSHFNIIGKYPKDAPGTQFSPHGLSVDRKNNRILTTDYVTTVTDQEPSAGIQYANTLRLWDLPSRTIINTITIPASGGIQNVKYIPGNPEGAALATAVSLGQVWIIYPLRHNSATGKQGVAQLLYDLGPSARDATTSYSDITQDGKFAYYTLTKANHIAVLDISDLNNVKRIDNPATVQPTIRPYYIKVTPNQKQIIVTPYHDQTDGTDSSNTPTDFQAWYMDINPNGSLQYKHTIDFSGQFRNRGGGKPRGHVTYDLTDPAQPRYY